MVTLTDGAEDTQHIESDMEKHVRFSGGAQAASEEDLRDNQFAGHLSKYYDRVISAIGNTESILILGPGEAKGELAKRLEHKNLGGRIVAVETVDKMTDRQIAARVREQFSTKG
jgi:stalled ribosome rescue protein Dom34